MGHEMAIDPSSKYSGQVDSDSGYPYGKARNRSAPAATDGTPLERDWLNDLWGLLQKILDYGSVTPSGTPESITASQYWNVLYAMARTIANGESLTVESGGSLYLENSGDATFLTFNDDITLIPAVISGVTSGFVRTDPMTLTQDTGPQATDYFVITVPLTPAATVTMIRVHLDGVYGHSGEIQYPPRVALYEIDTVGGQTLIDDATDPELVSGIYEDDHSFDLTGLSQTMGETGKSYQVRVYGEGGTNALAGTQFNAVRIFYQVSKWSRY